MPPALPSLHVIEKQPEGSVTQSTRPHARNSVLQELKWDQEEASVPSPTLANSESVSMNRSPRSGSPFYSAIMFLKLTEELCEKSPYCRSLPNHIGRVYLYRVVVF